MSIKASSYRLHVFCKKHPRYRGIRPSICDSCFVIFNLIHGGDDGHVGQAKQNASHESPLSRTLTKSQAYKALKGLVVKTASTPTALEYTEATKKKKCAEALLGNMACSIGHN
ncbi:MAG: hypothetical protein A2457_01915 [Candidatus Yanofskybacteria bacterium RIFOXYC2_FULL_44_13]|nr:MAG: hypothetical protein A2371_01090 [Candidatus Yanofskybacteria bacterium RIFOXYB1_FULL_44_29]OGN40613.1 MAG: hypothetical protein A2457_01915 [Candidatus Yanofskybacteria bacterium RIFOXYC2_FULL_44_13]